METDREFYVRRAAEERRAAARALSPEARARHQDLADTYAAKLRAMAGAGDDEAGRPAGARPAC
ncbi:hypothetical protein RCO27_14660 [Sphingosinicella sp. LHD-64]|uniref:hypothetical protein n=1 Tax=Sphingosinicella sp. LHD-64 TaxID=3072139 RepID=UPI00281080C2|nr:hypothetical protein [Sphingosinicella sp. LHD-64]MDQ8757470.1 hypothetical protein [Sphingosinicella sp. LHD-64]